MTAQGGSGNFFPSGECTQYADEQYFIATGLYVPWSGNAGTWAMSAPRYGWTVSASPVIPSIICLQPNVQGAGGLGHVGIVRQIKGNQIVTDNLNWQPTPAQVTSVNHQPGPGVSFIYATDDTTGKPLNQQSPGVTQTIQQVLQNSPIQIGPNADVTQFLWSMDQIMALINPFQVSNTTTDTALGVSFTDPISWLQGFGLNLVEDLAALVLRLIFLLVGALLMYRVLNQFIHVGALT